VCLSLRASAGVAALIAQTAARAQFREAEVRQAVAINPRFDAAENNRGLTRSDRGDEQGACSDDKGSSVWAQHFDGLVSGCCRCMVPGNGLSRATRRADLFEL
jgi:hypothetical protein